MLVYSCKPVTYKTTIEICVEGHYEKQMVEVGGVSVARSTMDAYRVEEQEVWVCDEYGIDTVDRIRWVLKLVK